MTEDVRITRLEEGEIRAWKAIESLAEKQEKLDDALAVLLDAQIKTEERFRADSLISRETDALLRETDAHLRRNRRAPPRVDAHLRVATAMDERIRRARVGHPANSCGRGLSHTARARPQPADATLSVSEPSSGK